MGHGNEGLAQPFPLATFIDNSLHFAGEKFLGQIWLGPGGCAEGEQPRVLPEAA
jgi:hypothetical protein